ncbi:MAG TPA: hypothetical protein VMZ53_20985 [Kofleriaceae bacterium]|nr:hypothetical protein [Kofleriaceae bacterium]
MNFGRTLSFVLAASLVPAIALADDPVDPYAPQQAPTTQQAPAPSTTTTVVAPAPQPQQPVVVVNPEPRAPRTTVITRDPETTEVYDQWNAPVFATGALVFAGSYGAGAIVASQSEHPGADRLYVPVVGPWLALNDWGDCPIEQPRCDKNTTDKVLLVADGVFQAAGVITMVSGLLSPTHHTVTTTRTASNTKAKITPTHNGFAVVGRF